jgi:hypothetical protein
MTAAWAVAEAGRAVLDGSRCEREDLTFGPAGVDDHAELAQVRCQGAPACGDPRSQALAVRARQLPFDDRRQRRPEREQMHRDVGAKRAPKALDVRAPREDELEDDHLVARVEEDVGERRPTHIAEPLLDRARLARHDEAPEVIAVDADAVAHGGGQAPAQGCLPHPRRPVQQHDPLVWMPADLTHVLTLERSAPDDVGCPSRGVAGIDSGSVGTDDLDVRKLLLMNDYDADPVWDLASEGMVGLDQLPVPNELRERVRAWAREWSERARSDDKGAGSDGEQFDAVGRRLWQELRTALSDVAEIGCVSFPGETRHVQWHPDGPVEPCPPLRGDAAPRG